VDPGEQTVLRIAQGYQLSQALYVAAKLGVADALASGPLSADSIAARVDARAAELRRVLCGLAAGGVFTELDDGSFSLNDASAALRANAPGRVRDVVINFGEEMYRAFGELLQTVRGGETAFELVYGKPLFDYYADNPRAEASGSARMLARTLPVARELAQVDVVGDARTLVDVGGGTGTVLVELLDRHPTLRAVLLERPGVLELARAYLSERGVDARCELVEGDFFASVPPGGDLYLLKSVLHDWDDQHCVTILRNCRQAMHSGSRLLLVESVMPAGDARHPARMLDTVMMILTPGGVERSEKQYGQLVEQAGFRLRRVLLTQSPVSVIEAFPAQQRR
jgi:hypothetical protein